MSKSLKNVFFFLYKENSCIYIGPQKLHDIIIIMEKLMKSRPYVCVCVCVCVCSSEWLFAFLLQYIKFRIISRQKLTFKLKKQHTKDEKNPWSPRSLKNSSRFLAICSRRSSKSRLPPNSRPNGSPKSSLDIFRITFYNWRNFHNNFL